VGDGPEKIELPDNPPVDISKANKQPAKGGDTPFSMKLLNHRSNLQRQYLQLQERYRKGFITRIEEMRQSTVVVFYSPGLLVPEDFQKLHDVLIQTGKVKNLDLFLLNPGGYAGPAFKISRLCQDLAEEKFSVLIPYYAKSAASILALGADEIIMGPASELGPIDPQVRALSSVTLADPGPSFFVTHPFR
jgi:ClpP class serine protease